MELMQKEKQESPPGDIINLYEKWKQTAALITQNRILKLKWLNFAEKTLENLLPLKPYLSRFAKIRINQKPYKINLIETHIQEQKPKKDLRKDLTENKSTHSPNVHPEIDNRKNSLEKNAEKSSYFYLDASLKKFLAGILNIRIPSVKIHTNPASDALVKKFNADALTYKNELFFKTGKYDPGDKKGIALLGHELTHAAQIKIQNFPEPTTTGYRDEEQQAMDNEKRVLNHFSAAEAYYWNKNPINQKPVDNSFTETKFNSSPCTSYESSISPDRSSSSSISVDSGKLNSIQTQVPRTALAARDLNSSSENANSYSTFQLSEQQFKAIKDEIYRDIMNRIRIEFERGG